MDPSRPPPVQPASGHFGELERSADAWQLRFDRVLPHSPERVWRALTDPADLAAWFPTTIDGDRAAGAPLSFAFENVDAPPMDGRMVTYEPTRLLEFFWGGDRLRFRLEPTAAGTRLLLEVTLDANGKAARDAAGWHTCLDGLDRLLSEPARPGVRLLTGWKAVHPGYVERFGPEAATIGPPDGHPD